MEAKMSCKTFSNLDKKHRLSIGSYHHDPEKSKRTQGASSYFRCVPPRVGLMEGWKASKNEEEKNAKRWSLGLSSSNCTSEDIMQIIEIIQPTTGFRN